MVEYNREIIGEGIALTRIYDDKFKTNNVGISLITGLSDETIAANRLAQALLATSNATVPSRTELTKQLLALYGSYINTKGFKVGDYQVCGLSVDFISDKFSIGNDNVSEKAVKILLDCLLNPDVKDGCFNEKYFAVRKQELVDSINATVNDKRSYAHKKANEIIYAGESASLSAYGSIETAQKLENHKVYEAYKKLLESAQIEITVSGNSEVEKIVEKVKTAILSIERKNIVAVSYRQISPLKAEVCEKTTQMDVKQSKMVMAFKTASTDIYGTKLMAMMYGGTAFSKLFSNVREKMSLCYYCSAGYSDTKGVMLVDSGVEQANIDKAKQEICHQLETLANGDFTDEELANTKLALCSGFKSNNDTVGDMNLWYFTQLTRGTTYSPEQQADIVSAVTREQIVSAAKSFTLDTVFVVEPEICEEMKA